MPSVPEYQSRGPSISPLQVANANPADFARPGREMSQLGEATSQLSNVSTDILVKEQDQKDLDSVFQAETALKAQETEFHNGLRERRGRNADGASKEALKFWEESTRKAEGTLTTERQRRAFQRIVADRRNASMDYVSRHEAQEMRTARLQAGEADIEATIQAGIANPGAVALNTTTIANTYRALAKAEGLDEDYVNLKIQSATTAMHTGVIAGMVDANPGGARLYYNANKDAIKPSERAQIESQLRAGGLKEFSQRKATEIFAKYGDDPEAALAYARANIQDADRQEATVAQLKARINEKQTFETHRQSKALDEAYRLVIMPQSSSTLPAQPVRTINDLPAHVLADLDGKDLVTLNNLLTEKLDGTKVNTNWEHYYNLTEMARTDPQAFATRNLVRDFPALDEGKRGELVKLQQEIRSGKANTTDVATLEQQLSEAYNTLGLADTDKEQKGRISSMARSEIAREQERLKKDLTYAERQVIIDRVTIQGTLSKSWWPDSTVRAYEVAPEDMGQFTPDGGTATPASPADPGGIPADERKRIEEALINRGKPVNEDAIQALYRMKHSR